MNPTAAEQHTDTADAEAGKSRDNNAVRAKTAVNVTIMLRCDGFICAKLQKMNKSAQKLAENS